MDSDDNNDSSDDYCPTAHEEQREAGYEMNLEKSEAMKDLSDPKSIKLYHLTLDQLKQACQQKNIKFSTIQDNLPFTHYQSGGGSAGRNDSKRSSGAPSNLVAVKNSVNNIIRENKLDQRESFLLSDTDFETILSYMLSVSLLEHDEYWFTFESFLKLREYIENTIGEMYLPYWVYSNLYQNNPNGYISTFLLYNYIKQLGFGKNMRYLLSHYDTGDGFIKNSDFTEFIVEIIKGFKGLRSQLGKKYTPFYVCNVTTWFFFFMDPLRSGKMKINDIVTSGFLEALNEDAILTTPTRPPAFEGNGDSDTNSTNNEVYWLSLAQMIEIYNFYLILDMDANGMISKEELKRFKNGILTDAFVNQLFCNSKLFDSQIDYKGFIKFIIAYNNSHTPQAIYYFFQLLDVNNDGFISAYDINFFYRDIYKDVSSSSPAQTVVTFNEIKSEIFDMVKPTDPDRFSVKELIRCNQGSTIIHLLISTEGYMNYEFKIIS